MDPVSASYACNSDCNSKITIASCSIGPQMNTPYLEIRLHSCILSLFIMLLGGGKRDPKRSSLLKSSWKRDELSLHTIA